MLTLQELIQKANQLVHEMGPEITSIIEEHQLKGEVPDIIAFLKNNQKQFAQTEKKDFDGLATALSKRRPISLQATHAALYKLLFENNGAGNILDNLESNLQSEKNNKKGKGMADSEELSQDDIEALLAGNAIDDDATSNKKEDISNDDIDALLNEVGMDASPPKEDDSGEMSQDDIEALLSGNDSPKAEPTKKETPKPAPAEENLSQDDIEALLGGGTTETTDDVGEMSQEDIEALLSGNEAKPAEEPRVESDQISEEDIQNLVDSQNDDDDIQALLEAQKEQDHDDPLISALGSESIESEETRIPSEVFPSANLDDILSEEQDPTPIPKIKAKEESIPSNEDLNKLADDFFEAIEDTNEEEAEEIKPTKTPEPREMPKAQSTPAKPANRATDQKPIVYEEPETTYKEYQSRDKDIRERVLQDIFALYVNTGGKPILQAECNTKEEIKKAYMMAMQSFPQNALFIEKISRKEIVVIKETKEIINLKINVSFE